MRNALAAVMLASLVPTLQAAPQERAVQWVAENNKWGTGGQLYGKFKSQLETAVAEGKSFSWQYGPGLFTSGKAHWLMWKHGDFFAFELSEAHVGLLGLSKMGFKAVEGGPDPVVANPKVALERLEIQDAEGLDGSKPFKGNVAYRCSEKPTGSVVLVASYRIDTRSMSKYYYIPGALADTGTVDFEIPSLNDSKDKEPFSGLLPVFLRIHACPDPKTEEGRDPISSTAGRLVLVK
jgi:hypothetical protein